MISFAVWTVLFFLGGYFAVRLARGVGADEIFTFIAIVYFPIGGLISFLLAVWTCCLTGEGLMPNYSEGERVGYVTKISRKGIFWKTWEVEMQMGAGEQAAIQAPHHFCVTDENLVKSIQENLGHRASIRYREWLVVPYRVGSAKSEILEIHFR